LIIWIHGGGWEKGDKENPPAVFLTTRGYAVASINYRLSNEAHFPAQIHDCKAAIRWLRGNAKRYNLDADHFGVWGGSAGGHLVALLGTTGAEKQLEGSVGSFSAMSSRVQAVCDWFGPTDLERLAEFKSSMRGLSPDYPMQMVCKLFGTSISKIKAPAAKANPTKYVSANSAPFLIMHGDKDNLVPLEQSELLSDALRRAGVDVTFRVVPGAGHEIKDRSSFGAVEQFFDKNLKIADNSVKNSGQPPTLVATYTHKAGNNPAGQIKFYSNGCLEDPAGPSTWVLKGNRLSLYWYNDNAPGGIWIDTCNLAQDNRTYRGQNQDKVPIVGERTSGSNLNTTIHKD
jgi:acetyl esterase/lipase